MNELTYCPVSKKCSGCQLSNMDYNRQLRYKQNELRIRFNRMCELGHVIPSPQPLHYRNKAQFAFKSLPHGKVACGIYQSVDKRIVKTSCCALHTELQNRTAEAIAELMEKYRLAPFDFHTGKGLIKSVILRESFSHSELMAVIICTDRTHFPCPKPFAEALVSKIPQISSVVITKSSGTRLDSGASPKYVLGKKHITQNICGLDFLVSYNSFFQINTAATETLYRTAIDMANLDKNDTALDAYCGTGTIGLIASKQCKRVFAAEINKNAIIDAKANAVQNNIKNVSFVCADCEDYMRDLAENDIGISAAFLDPPRAGCSRSFLSALCSVSPKRIVYISCNIDTQLRDARFLIKQGYTLKKVQGVDMFPYTSHIESIALFVRQ